MFTPETLLGKIFRKYLLGFKHAGKIRIQNILGRIVFSRGIRLSNQDGTRFLLEANDWITRIILIEGAYEPGSTSLAKRLLKNGGVFVDIGANFGLFSCLAAHTNGQVKVISIEPNYRVIGRLLKNIHLNSLQDRVRVFNTAASNNFHFVSLQQPAAGNMGTTQTSATARGELSILSCSLDFLCEQNETLVIDLIKIDIEGNEFDVFKDFAFEKYVVKNIILEYNHLSNIGFEELLSFFERKGFKSLTISGEPLISGSQPIHENNIWFQNQQVLA